MIARSLLARAGGPLVALATLATLVACSGSADVSVGHNDRMSTAPDPNRMSDVSYGPRNWDVPTTTCDEQRCQIGPDCRLVIGDCESHWGIAVGACSHLPDACGDDVAPVCGCNGRTYANPCLAARAGVGLLRMTPCE
jgi:Kazal-type serine protease inhibitor domain